MPNTAAKPVANNNSSVHPRSKICIGIKNEVESNTLELYFTDYIYDGFDWYTWEDTNMVQDTIDKVKAANPSTIKITINSLGGDVMIGLALYNFLVSYKSTKEVNIIGFAASIASIIAMCASPGKLRMAKNSFMIIHAAWSLAIGNAKEMRKQADNLDSVTDNLADIYAQRSGKTIEYFTKLWDDGDYWMDASEAVEIGLCDEAYTNNSMNAQATVDFSGYNFSNIPAALVNKPTAAVTAPPADVPADHESFFTKLNNTFMGFFDKLTGGFNNANKDPKFNNVTDKTAITDYISAALKPLCDELDAMKPAQASAGATEVPAATETTPAATTVADPEKPATETAPAATTATTAPTTATTEAKPAEAPTTQAATDTAAILAEIQKLKDDNANLRASLANQATKPVSTNAGGIKDLASRAKIEY